MVVREADHYGGARFVDVAAAEFADAWVRRGRAMTVRSSGVGAGVRLADARDYRWEGFPVHFIFNAGDSTDSIDLVDNDDTVLRSIPVGFMVTVGLEEQLDAAGSWGVSQPRAFNAALPVA